METRDQYVIRKKRQLDKWSADMDHLEASAHKVASDVQALYQEQLLSFRAKRKEGEKRIEAIKLSAEDSWDHLKAETENIWGALKDSFHQFKSHF